MCLRVEIKSGGIDHQDLRIRSLISGNNSEFCSRHVIKFDLSMQLDYVAM